MRVGNDVGGNDIVFNTAVGENKPGSFKIANNMLHIYGENQNKQLEISNHPSSVNVSSTGKLTTSSFFNIEPGKCFYTELEAKSIYNRKVRLSSNVFCSMSKFSFYYTTCIKNSID